MIFIGIVMWI